MTEAQKSRDPACQNPLEIDEKLVLQEPAIGKVSVVFFFAFAVACLSLLLSFSGEKTVAWLMYLFGLVFSVFYGLDALQRRVVFQRHQVCVRRVWIWRRTPLPENVRIQEGRNGELELVSTEEDRVLFRLGREYDPVNKYLERLQELLGHSVE